MKKLLLTTLAAIMLTAPTTQTMYSNMLRRANDFVRSKGDQAAIIANSRGISNTVAPWIAMENTLTPKDWNFFKQQPTIVWALRLKLVDFNDTQLQEVVTKCPYLQKLDLSGCSQITDAGLAHLARLTELQSLNLRDCDQITDDGLSNIVKLPSLKSLNLSACWEITDDGLAYLVPKHDKDNKLLSGCPYLQSLNLYGCDNITNAGLKHLAKLANLESLYLSNFSKITYAGMKALKVALPMCNIILE